MLAVCQSSIEAGRVSEVVMRYLLVLRLDDLMV